MSADSPVAILYSTDGYQIAVTPGAAIGSNPRSLPIAGTDGTNSRTISVTTDGYIRGISDDLTNKVSAVEVLPLVGSTYSYTTSQGVGALPGNIKSSAGNIFSLYIFNANASNRFFQLFNSTGAPSGTPLMSFMIPGGGSVVLGTDFFGPGGFNFSTGITAGMSTTQTTYTAATAGETNYVIGYK